MLNQQGLFEDDDDQVIMSGTQTGFFSFPPNMTLVPSSLPPLKTLATIPPSLAVDTPSNPATGILFSSASSKQRDDIFTSHHLGLPQLSLQRSTSNLWAWGEVTGCCMSSNKRSSAEGDDHLGVSAGMRMKKIIKGRRRKVREPRFCFKTLSDVDVLDDGYKWRKYGQKVVKNTLHPRSYYRCTQDNCRVKKRVERLAEDPRMVITTYEGRHAHSPSHDEDDSRLPPSSSLFW